MPPVDFTATPTCNAGAGEILANNYTGGNGSYEWIAIATSPANAISYVNGVGGTRYSAGTSYNFTSLSDGTYYIALKDTAGNVGVTSIPGITIACATTTTTSTTTTTTTPEPTTTTTSTTTTTTTPAPTTTTTTTTTSTTTTTTTAPPVYLYCVGYSAGGDCCLAIDDHTANCGGGGGGGE